MNVSGRMWANCFVILALLYSTDAAITSWTLPAAGDASESIAENSASATAVATIVAVSDANLEAYTLLTTGTPFTLAAGGALTVTSAILDFETTPTYKLIIQVVDDAPATATATLTVSLTDANDAPTFGSTCAVSGSPAGTEVYTLAATDQDSGDTLTYSITGGNTDNDFEISTDKIVTVNALDMLRTASYDLEVEVSDTTATDTTTVTLSVSATCNSNSATPLLFSLLTVLTCIVVALN